MQEGIYLFELKNICVLDLILISFNGRLFYVAGKWVKTIKRSIERANDRSNEQRIESVGRSVGRSIDQSSVKTL